jgi:hypothetical protein
MNWWALDPNLSPLAREPPKSLPEATTAPTASLDLARRVEELETLVDALRERNAP